MGIACSIKVKNLSNRPVVVCDKLIPAHKFAYFDKENLLEDTDAYRLEQLGLLEIEEIAADGGASLDLPEELDGYKHNILDENGNLIGKKIWYDAARQHLWYEMSMTLTSDRLPDVVTERFYYYDGSLMFERKKQFVYDPETGMLLDEIPIT